MSALTSKDGIALYEKVWPSPEAPKGTVLIVHGYGEHITRYDHVAVALGAAGWAARGYDQRGHGQSGGLRGHCTRFSDYLDDLSLVLARARQSLPDKPLFILGHSFGALVSTRYAFDKGAELDGLVVTSPYWKLKLDVPKIKIVAGKLMSAIYPTLGLPSGLKGADVSHDPEMIALYDRDPLNNKNATARWFTESTAAQEEVAARAGDLKIPCLVMHGGGDKIADPAQTELVFARIGSADKQLKIYPGQYHEILNEVAADRAKTIADVVAWLTSHAAAAATGKLRAGGT